MTVDIGMLKLREKAGSKAGARSRGNSADRLASTYDWSYAGMETSGRLRRRRPRCFPKSIPSKALIAVGILLSATSCTEAASLRKLDDGNVELRAYDERMVFRIKDAETIYVDAATCDRSSGRTTLQRWLTDPTVASCLDRTIPDHVPSDLYSGIELHISLQIENGLVYPGGIRMDGLSKSSLEPRQLSVRLGPLFWNLSSSADQAGAWKPGPLGYEQLGAENPWIGDGVLYRLPASKRQGQDGRPLLVACSLGGAVVCSIILRSKPGFAVVALSWRSDAYPRKGEMLEGPTARWTTYDGYARAIADSIFIFRPQGNLQ